MGHSETERDLLAAGYLAGTDHAAGDGWCAEDAPWLCPQQHVEGCGDCSWCAGFREAFTE